MDVDNTGAGGGSAANPSTIPPRNQHIPDAGRMRRPYLTEEDFRRGGGSGNLVPTNGSVPTRTHNRSPIRMLPNHASATTSDPSADLSESETRRRIFRQARLLRGEGLDSGRTGGVRQRSPAELSREFLALVATGRDATAGRHGTRRENRAGSEEGDTRQEAMGIGMDMDENHNEEPTPHPDASSSNDGWRELEEALSTHIERRNARNLEASLRAELQAHYMIPLTEEETESSRRAARRRDERISALLDRSSNAGQNFRLRRRASRERILAEPVEGFLADRERQTRLEWVEEGIAEFRDWQMESDGLPAPQGESVRAQLTERLVADMRERDELRARQMRELASGGGAISTMNTPTYTKTRTMLSYLSRLLDCSASLPEEASALANELGINYDHTLLTSTSTISPPAYSSLLTPGATFTGSQHSPPPTSVSRDRDYLRRMVASRDRNRTWHRSEANQNRSSSHLAPQEPTPGSMSLLASAEQSLAQDDRSDRPMDPHPRIHFRGWDYHLAAGTNGEVRRRPSRTPHHWPVSVTLHSVDFEAGTLTGTMVAEHIPDDKGGGSASEGNTGEEKLEEESGCGETGKGNSMSSFFDGEIVDFRKVSLETERYKMEGVRVDKGVDARYWMGVGPFREVCGQQGDESDKDSKLATFLRSRDSLDQIMQDWVLMRWKERCFLPTANLHPRPHATSSSSTSFSSIANGSSSSNNNSNTWGLTISGFYYVAMKRDSGTIEGLYYDPESQPYQRLELGVAGWGGGEGRGGWGGGAVRRWFPSVGFG